MKLFFVIALLVMLTTSVRAGLRVFNEDGDLNDVDVTPDLERPSHILEAGESNLFELTKTYDVVVLFAWQKYDCHTCGENMERFFNAARNANPEFLKEGDTAWVTLDVDAESDEYYWIQQENPDFHWYVPAVMVFKSKHIHQFKRPPMLMVLNENLERELPALAERFRGPDIHEVSSIEQLDERIFNPHTESVSIVEWNRFKNRNSKDDAWNHTSKAVAFRRVAELERLSVFFSSITPEFPEEEASYRNPDDADIIAYVVASHEKKQIQRYPFNFKPPLSKRKLKRGVNPEDFTSFRDFLRNIKTFRPGHEYDNHREYTVWNMEKRECEEDETARKGDRVRIHYVGRALTSGLNYTECPDKGQVFTLLEELGSVPSGVHGAIDGMCPGMVRRVFIPPHMSYSEGGWPPTIQQDENLLFWIRLIKLRKKGVPPDFDDHEL